MLQLRLTTNHLKPSFVMTSCLNDHVDNSLRTIYSTYVLYILIGQLYNKIELKLYMTLDLAKKPQLNPSRDLKEFAPFVDQRVFIYSLK